jgi:DNA-binding response OmpR family regulator
VPITVVLAVGLDSTQVETHRSVWKSSGFFVIAASTIQTAIDHFKAGDFDLVLLGDSLPFDKKERLAYLIRASGSRVPVVSIGDPSSDPDSYADATLRSDPKTLLTGISAIVAERAKTRRPPPFLIGELA